MSTLLIVDGNNIAHRVRYKFDLSNNGVDVSVTFGFLKVLLSYISKTRPEAVMVAWDGGIPNYRREKVPSYKSNRDHGAHDPLAYQDFIRQMDELIEVSLPLMGVLAVRKRYVEADDLAYHAAFMASLSGHYKRIIVASADEDLMQVVNIPGCVVLNPNKNELRGAQWIESELGIPPTSFAHWKALQGDSSDNIPGVVGIGPKTASKLFQEFGSLSGIVNAASGSNPVGKIEGKLKESILSFGFEQLSRNVHTIVLAYDRTGARQQILNENWFWEPANVKEFKKYLLQNAFISIMDGSTFSKIKELKKPVFATDLRVPVICGTRRPI